MRLIHEILDIRYARDTSDLDEDDTFDETNPDDVARKAERDERTRQANVFPIFIIDLFSKKYGLKSLVESTTWDLLYSCDCLRNKGLCPDVDVFCLFIEMHYDADEVRGMELRTQGAKRRVQHAPLAAPLTRAPLPPSSALTVALLLLRQEPHAERSKCQLQDPLGRHRKDP